MKHEKLLSQPLLTQDRATWRQEPESGLEEGNWSGGQLCQCALEDVRDLRQDHILKR